jgi:hypothetical protein
MRRTEVRGHCIWAGKFTNQDEVALFIRDLNQAIKEGKEFQIIMFKDKNVVPIFTQN